MNNFLAKGGQFWLNDQPQLIQAGEFHYFRTPQDQWRHRLDILEAAGFNALATYIPWIWHQLAENVSDLDGHSHPMRNLAGFLDLATEMGFWIIARPGPYIMAETINEGIPPWVFKNYPQVSFISQDRKTQNIASYMHPDFLACVKKWYQAIFKVLAPRQITRGGKIIMVQLDNEMGMMQWVRNIMDTNPDTLSRFAAHLNQAYGQHLSDRYPTDHLADFLQKSILNPQEHYGVKIVEDYRIFYRNYLREYTSFLWSEAKSNGLEVLPVINIHGYGNGGKTFPIGLSQLESVISLDGMISATDVYPLFIGESNFHQILLANEMTKALQNKHQPLFSIEFQAGGNTDFGNGQTSLYDLHSRLCISEGMRAINHYLFFDGENDPILSPVKRHNWGQPVRKDGTPRNHYYRYGKLSKVLAAYGSDLIMSQPETVTTVGFILDYYLTEVNNEFTKDFTKLITRQRDNVLFDMIARGLSLTHRPFNALELGRDDLDVSKTPNCWVMMEKQCNAEIQRKLVDYINQGGNLILVGRMCEEDFSHAACTILRDAIGIKQIHDHKPFEPEMISAFNDQDVPISFLETCSGEFNEVFARDRNGEAVGFIKSLGKGKVLFFGAALPVDTLADLDVVHQMALKIGCLSLFNPVPWADIRFSRGDNGSFLFINNYLDDPVETTIESGGETMFGGNPVKIAPRKGVILPVEWQFRQGITIHYTTSEIVEIIDHGSVIILKTERDEFFAEMTLRGYACEPSESIQETAGAQRVRLHGSAGEIIIKKKELR